MKFLMVILAALFTTAGAALADCKAHHQFDLRAFFQSSDVQYETADQFQTLSDALRRLADHPESIRIARFPDYQGNPDRWSFIEVLDHYLVPSPTTFVARNGGGPAIDAMISAAGCPDGKATILDRLKTLPPP